MDAGFVQIAEQSYVFTENFVLTARHNTEKNPSYDSNTNHSQLSK